MQKNLPLGLKFFVYFYRFLDLRRNFVSELARRSKVCKILIPLTNTSLCVHRSKFKIIELLLSNKMKKSARFTRKYEYNFFCTVQPWTEMTEGVLFQTHKLSIRRKTFLFFSNDPHLASCV